MDMKAMQAHARKRQLPLAREMVREYPVLRTAVYDGLHAATQEQQDATLKRFAMEAAHIGVQREFMGFPRDLVLICLPDYIANHGPSAAAKTAAEMVRTYRNEDLYFSGSHRAK